MALMDPRRCPRCGGYLNFPGAWWGIYPPPMCRCYVYSCPHVHPPMIVTTITAPNTAPPDTWINA